MSCQPDRPNVVLFIVHDLGMMTGAGGADPLLKTPNLDRLAAEGVCFENHFATAPFCSPSRGGILTGMAPHVNGLMGLVNLGWDMPANTMTAGHLFRAAGYETLLFGLQHEAKDAERLGFDYISDRSASFGSQAVVPLVTNHLADNSDGRDRPFYMQIGFCDVHRRFPEREFDEDQLAKIQPLRYLADTRGMREDLWDFYGYVEAMDRNVGKVLDMLDSTGQRDNTIVIFTTDHGIAFPRAKSTLYDAGIRTTLLMRWPGVISEGARESALLSNVDLLPTLMEAAGAAPLKDIQGLSFMGLLTGRSYTARDYILAELNTLPWNTVRCIRTVRHKYIRNYNPGPLPRLPSDIERSKTRRDMGKPPLWTLEPEELYDIEDDPVEMKNLVGNRACSGVLADLRSALLAFQRETDDPILQGPVPRPEAEQEIIERAYNKRVNDERK